MRKSPILIAASLTLLAFAVCAARAKDDTEGFARRLLAVKSVEQKTYACFMRSYDASHLARHARQKVGTMKLLVAAERLPEDSALSYSFRLGVKLRNHKGDFVSNGDCGPAAAGWPSGSRPMTDRSSSGSMRSRSGVPTSRTTRAPKWSCAAEPMTAYSGLTG